MRIQNNSEISRRAFLKWSTAAAAVASTAGLTGCGGGNGDEFAYTGDPGKDYEVLEGGEWRCGSCWLPCGGSCVNKAYVKDGVVLQQKTDAVGYDDMDNVQQRSCARGRSLRHLVYGADRLKYPIKRKNWQPGGGANINGALRGVDEWERISWDDAFEMIASEVSRIVGAYGNKSIYMPGRAASRSLMAYGGYSPKVGARSYGGSYFPAMRMMAFTSWPYHSPVLPDRYEYQNSKLIVLWGHSPSWSAQCNSIVNFMAAKEAGARFIVVDPIYHDSAKVLDAEYIPVRPGEDVALLLACANVMIREGWQDQTFLDTYTLGFDAAHMPPYANPAENFRDYVMGVSDGIEKTPAWASQYCGTPVNLIESLAYAISHEKPMAFTTARAAARVSNGEEFAQAFFTVGWMTGNVGKPGACVGQVVTSNVGSGNSGQRLFQVGSAPQPNLGANPVSPYSGSNVNPFDMSNWFVICTGTQWHDILRKKSKFGMRGDVDLDIRMIAHMNQADNFNCGPDILKGIEAHRAVDFVLSCALTMDTRSTYADIVLPAATPWEMGATPLMSKFNREALIANQKITDPIFDTRSDTLIEMGIAEALGIDPKLINQYDTDEEQAIRIFATTNVLGADGTTWEKLFTITAEDIPEGVTTVTPQQGKITIKQFREAGLYKVKRSKDDNYGFIPYKAFIDDPVTNALPPVAGLAGNTSPSAPHTSGKFEIHCQRLADEITAYGYTVKGPIAKYGHWQEGWQDTYSDWGSQIKGPYPLMGLSVHLYRTVHSTFDNVPQIREAFPNNLRINPADAAERGINTGDTVLISSRWGRTLRHAQLTERVMKGVVLFDQVMLADIDPETGIDRGGSFNVLTGSFVSGSNVQPCNSCNVQVERWTGAPIVADCLLPQRIVEV
jgi:anaerobic dimethyl sulfoxide reductase subunit A